MIYELTLKKRAYIIHVVYAFNKNNSKMPVFLQIGRRIPHVLSIDKERSCERNYCLSIIFFPASIASMFSGISP